MGPELGVLLADADSLGAALTAAEALPWVQWFLMDDGVRAASDPRLRAAGDAGAEITVCAMDAEARALGAVDGVRFGSQWEHALMIRDAREILALTGAAPTRSRPAPTSSPSRGHRRVLVRVTRPQKVAQALRTAVGYAAADLDVRVAAPPELLDARDPLVARALGTLRGLGCPVDRGAAPADVEVIW